MVKEKTKEWGHRGGSTLKHGVALATPNYYPFFFYILA